MERLGLLSWVVTLMAVGVTSYFTHYAVPNYIRLTKLHNVPKSELENAGLLFMACLFSLAVSSLLLLFMICVTCIHCCSVFWEANRNMQISERRQQLEGTDSSMEI